MGGKRRLIREGGGGGGYLSGQGSRSVPAPRWGSGIDCFPTTDDVFQTVEQSGGGSLLAPPGALAECTERTMAEDTHGRACPHDDDFELRPRTGTIGMSEDGVPIRNIESPYGGGVRSLPGATGNCLPVMVPTAPVPPADGPQLGSWRVAVVQVEETPTGDASGSEFPCADTDRQRPIELLDVAGNVCPALLPPPRAGLLNFVGPVGLSSHAEKTPEPLEHMVHTQTDPAGRMSPPDRYSVGRSGLPPHAEKNLEPLEHMIRTQTDPAGQFAAVGTLSPSDCYPVGPYATGGPVGPDVYITYPNSLTHMVRIPPDPDGQDAAATGTPSPSDCYPAGPAGPYVAGSPVAPEVKELLALLVLDHADPAGQHAAIQNTTCLLEHLPARPEPSLGGRLVERISDEEPTVRQVPGTALDSQLMEGITYLEHPA